MKKTKKSELRTTILVIGITQEQKDFIKKNCLEEKIGESLRQTINNQIQKNGGKKR